jgi:hypothetical protein
MWLLDRSYAGETYDSPTGIIVVASDRVNLPATAHQTAGDRFGLVELWDRLYALMWSADGCDVLSLAHRPKVANLEQRLYEWCLTATDKAGTTRCDLDVTTCFVPLLHWIIRLWTGTHLALTIDATSLSDRFVVLAICVVYRGCAIPVAWTILPAGHKRAWRGEWLRLLRRLRPAIPADWQVLVLDERGLYARWLFRRIVRLGWHHSCGSTRVVSSVRLAEHRSSGCAISSGRSATGGGAPEPRLPRRGAI